MKNLKLIALMMLVANIVFAQNYSAPGSVTGTKNTIVGANAGTGGASSSQCTFLGYATGVNSNTWNNTFIGARAGELTTGGGNLAFGSLALNEGATGKNNIAIGNNAGRRAKGDFNISIGANSGKADGVGNNNMYIGYASGVGTIGDNNLFLGSWTGQGLGNISNKLYIDHAGDATGGFAGDVNTPLIYGDFATHQVGIGTNDVGNYALAVKGHVVAEEVTINLYDAANGGWPDYVFAEDYDLMPLTELETEIETLGHLPGVPSAEEVYENGHKVGEMDAILLEKVEELTLHLIDMNKAIEALQQSEKELREENEALKAKVTKK